MKETGAFPKEYRSLLAQVKGTGPKLASTGRFWVVQLMCVLQMSSGQISQDLWFQDFQHLDAKILLQTVGLVNHEWLRIVRQLSNKYISFTQDFGDGYCSKYVRPLASVPCSSRPWEIRAFCNFPTRWHRHGLTCRRGQTLACLHSASVHA